MCASPSEHSVRLAGQVANKVRGLAAAYAHIHTCTHVVSLHLHKHRERGVARQHLGKVLRALYGEGVARETGAGEDEV
jgi:hypothetical protein